MSARNPLRSWCLAVTAFALGVVFVATARADAGADAEDVAASTTVARLAPKEERRRLGRLRAVSARWYAHRTQYPRTCHHCHGRGTIPVTRAERQAAKRQGKAAWQAIVCPTCDGRKSFISERAFFEVRYDAMSPEFRRQPRTRADVERLYEQVRTNDPLPRKIRNARLKKAELVGPEHAIAWHRFDGDPTWFPTHWVWATEGDGRYTWFMYEPTADGAWPGRTEDGAAPRTAAYPQIP